MRTSLGKWIVRLRRYQPGDSMSVEVKWTAGGVPSKAERGAVLSVFYCRFYGPERMDCFLNRGFHNLLSCFRRPVMVFRIEHSTVDAAEEETKTSCLPIDGVIGVCTRLGTTYRIKKPTVDLYALEDGLATGSAARHVMTRLNRVPRMLPGNVYERQLSLKPGGDYEIESFCYSPGKLHGNSKMVFESILLNASDTGMRLQ
uniref:Uncharacterized protein n=1 Tax=Hyaloperonospora arabidopsidis (strain Emoy2) TaxID=559515 RepID=M4C1R1_HYAAE